MEKLPVFLLFTLIISSMCGDYLKLSNINSLVKIEIHLHYHKEMKREKTKKK